MRCLIPVESVTPDRFKFLLKVFGLGMMPKQLGEYGMELVSVPSTELDILFIIGHNLVILDYLRQHMKNIKENIIVVISCSPKCFNGINLCEKKLFVAPTDSTSDAVDILEGANYGFDFNISEAELNLYNCKGLNVLDKIEKVFVDIEDL